jgi:hypothetical protein
VNGYVFFYSGRKTEIRADSMLEAKEKAVAHFQPSRGSRHMVHGYLVEKDGKPVIQATTI